MTFLYNDQLINTLLQLENGMPLTKEAQQKADAARALAISLGNKTLHSMNMDREQPAADIFVRDLTDLLAFVNYLYKTGQRYNQHLIAIHPNRQDTDNIDKNIYVPYSDFYVYREGLLQYLRNLDAFAHRSDDANARTMRPLIKNLIESVNKELGANFTSIKDMPGALSKQGPTIDEVNKMIQEQGPKPELVALLNKLKLEQQNMPSSSGVDSAYQRVSDKSNTQPNSSQSNNSTVFQEDLTAFKNSLPFQKEGVISPYHITLFIRAINNILVKDNPQSGQQPMYLSGPMQGQFRSLAAEIETAWQEWQNFISTKSQNKSLRDEVPYDTARTPNDDLTSMIGNKQNAQEAAKRLLQMVIRVRQALVSIKESPKLSSILGPEILEGQEVRARNFEARLTPFSRS